MFSTFLLSATQELPAGKVQQRHFHILSFLSPLGHCSSAGSVMLSAAKHLAAHRERPFALLRACPERSEEMTSDPRL
jgi:hypothetical protein